MIVWCKPSMQHYKTESKVRGSFYLVVISLALIQIEMNISALFPSQWVQIYTSRKRTTPLHCILNHYDEVLSLFHPTRASWLFDYSDLRDLGKTKAFCIAYLNISCIKMTHCTYWQGLITIFGLMIWTKVCLLQQKMKSILIELHKSFIKWEVVFRSWLNPDFVSTLKQPLELLPMRSVWSSKL